MSTQLELFRDEIDITGVKEISITNYVTGNIAKWNIRPTLDPELFILKRSLGNGKIQELVVEKYNEGNYTIHR